MHIVGKENMEVFLSKLHYLWNVISLFKDICIQFLLWNLAEAWSAQQKKDPAFFRDFVNI